MIFPDEITRNSYSNVLEILYSTQFEYTLKLDENRMMDGIDLRYHFSYACHIPYELTESVITSECSILEMMAALAKRCDDDIMFDLSYGDRTSLWFKMMFDNLGLTKYTNLCWSYSSEYEIRHILKKCMFRQYNADGTNGGLFIIHQNANIDLRNLQIWDQMCLCMSELTY